MAQQQQHNKKQQVQLDETLAGSTFVAFIKPNFTVRNENHFNSNVITNDNDNENGGDDTNNKLSMVR